MHQDPFKALGVSPTASLDEGRNAYRKLAKKYHPDLNSGDQSHVDLMAAINLAYDEAVEIINNGGKPLSDQDEYDR